MKSADFIMEHRTCSVLVDKIGQLFVINQSTDCIYVIIVTVIYNEDKYSL